MYPVPYFAAYFAAYSKKSKGFNVTDNDVKALYLLGFFEKVYQKQCPKLKKPISQPIFEVGCCK